MLTRALSGAVFVAILVACILYSALSLKILFLVISILGLYEFYGIVGIKQHKIVSTIVGALAFIALVRFYNFTFNPLAVIAFGSALFLFLELFSKEGSFNSGALRIAGIIYIVVPLVLVCRFPVMSGENSLVVLCMFILVWSNDTGAYLFGRAFGKNKLFTRISPNKTIEGLIGGGVAAVGVSFLLSQYLVTYSPLVMAIMALIVFAFANLGDLVESMLKRNYGVKDSGNIIPGHGGILDRFDAVLLTIPAIYLFLQLFQL